MLLMDMTELYDFKVEITSTLRLFNRVNSFWAVIFTKPRLHEAALVVVYLHEYVHQKVSLSVKYFIQQYIYIHPKFEEK